MWLPETLFIVKFGAVYPVSGLFVIILIVLGGEVGEKTPSLTPIDSVFNGLN